MVPIPDKQMGGETVGDLYLGLADRFAEAAGRGIFRVEPSRGTLDLGTEVVVTVTFHPQAYEQDYDMFLAFRSDFRSEVRACVRACARVCARVCVSDCIVLYFGGMCAWASDVVVLSVLCACLLLSSLPQMAWSLLTPLPPPLFPYPRRFT